MMTLIEMYLDGFINLNQLIFKLSMISSDKNWIKDILSTILNTKDYNVACKMIGG